MQTQNADSKKKQKMKAEATLLYANYDKKKKTLVVML